MSQLRQQYLINPLGNREAEMFIDTEYIENLLKTSKNKTGSKINQILDKADRLEGLSHQDIAVLLTNDSPEINNRVFTIARKIKEHIYGNRIVMFAPLYVSDYCINKCSYCSYNCAHKFNRKKLSMDEVRDEVKLLEEMGHKRIGLEAVEDDHECPID